MKCGSERVELKSRKCYTKNDVMVDSDICTQYLDDKRTRGQDGNCTDKVCKCKWKMR